MSSELDDADALGAGDMDLQALKRELRVWRHNRALYPGWLLAPYQTREEVWLNTKQWLHVAMEASDAWPEREVLVLWRELTWRLGICLQIVPDEALDKIRGIVDGFEDLIHGGVMVEVGDAFPETDGWPSDFGLAAQELRDCWLACKLALLQGYRFRPDIEAFEEVESQLHSVRELSTDQRCFVLHQSCLRTMAELDAEQTQRLLARWPNDPEDDYWLVRKAAVLLELGDLQAARRVADDALLKIRGRQQTRDPDYWKLSREGWCLRLLEHVEFLEGRWRIGAPVDATSGKQGAEEWKSPAWKSRLDHKLESARCSPETELRALRGQINKRPSPGRPLHSIANPPSFDTGDVSRSIRLSMDIPSDRLAPAINLLLGGDAMGYSLAGDFGRYSLSWLRDEFPGLWAAFALRFGGIGVSQEPDPSGEANLDSIRRTTLEQLPRPHVERLFGAALQELERSVERAEAGEGARMSGLRSGALLSVVQLSDLVTRLSMRLDADAREPLAALLLKTARMPLFRRLPAEQATIWHLVERTIPYLEGKQLQNWFFKILLNFPLDSSEIERGRGLPCISDYLRSAKVNEVIRKESEEIDAGVRRLIGEVGSSDTMTRTDAALRLLLLADRSLLSEVEVDAFAEALWKDVDDCHLPTLDKRIAKHVHLSWPCQVEDQNILGLTRWIMSGSVEDRFGISDDNGENGERKEGVRWTDSGVYLKGILDLARELENDTETFKKVFDERRRRHILESILDWWTRERDLFRIHANLQTMMSGDVFWRADLSFRAIFECTLGKEELNEKTRERLSFFLHDIEEFGRSSPYRFPIMACINRNEQVSAWKGIRSGLWSSNHEEAYKALIAAWTWQRCAKRLDLMPMPESVLTIIVSAMASLEGVVGYHGYPVLGQLLKNGNLQIENEEKEQIVAAVESAAGKLAYGKDLAQLSVSDQERRVHVRRNLAELIVCLQSRDVMVGRAGVSWISEAKEDTFVDIRRIAKKWRN